MQIFLDDQDYRWFLFLLGEVVEEFDLACWNYCVMPNHYHATLCPTRPNISKAMQCLNGEYAQWWNARHGRVGHAFQGRFKDQIVQREGYLLAVCRYVALNPVRAHLSERPEDWPWSSYAATIGLKQPAPFLRTELTLGLFGNGAPQTQGSGFAEFVLRDPDDPGIVDRIRSNERVLGDRPFKTSLKEATASATRIAAPGERCLPSAGSSAEDENGFLAPAPEMPT